MKQVFLRILVGAVIGAFAGYAVYVFIGCRTGACPLTSNLGISVIVYSIIGALIAKPVQ
ncbi:MAG TPA: DUF6132 family protein [Kiritimatiellia bacterium]|nr:DUF6132 family protein [Kiritimatiellia bacterium]